VDYAGIVVEIKVVTDSAIIPPFAHQQIKWIDKHQELGECPGGVLPQFS